MKLNLTPENQPQPVKGCVLLAEPFLNDPYFKRTVILLCEHNDEGTFGFVLNNYIDVELDQVMDDMPTLNTRVSIGGPVKNSNLYYLHTLGTHLEDSVEVIEGVYLGGDFDALKDKITKGEVRANQVRFFVGYAGWSPSQLDAEIRKKSWYITNITADTLMDTHHEDLWKTVMEQQGSSGSLIANLPEDPSLN